MEFLDQSHLAVRWNISERTLEQWRWLGKGPRYVKLGGRVRYPLLEIERYEAENLHANTNGALPTSAAGLVPREFE